MRGMRRWCAFALAFGILALAPASAAADTLPSASASSALPRFKWGQTKDKVFLTIAVRDLDRASARIAFAEDRVRFAAVDAAGKAYHLDLELAHDVDPAGCHWEQLQRRDRWGDAVRASLLKRFPAPWDALVEDPVPYRQVMDRDWTQDDQSLGSLEEDAYLSDHSKYLPLLAMDGLDAAQQGVEALVINVRHSVCEQCKVGDDTFAQVAKKVAGAKSGSWESRIRLALVDARAERRLARLLGASCARTPPECWHSVLAPGGDGEPIRIRARHSEASLLEDLERLARTQFEPIAAAKASEGRAGASRGLVVIGPDAVVEVKRSMHRIRLRMDIAVAETQLDAANLGLSKSGGTVLAVAWSPGEVEPAAFAGPAETLETWLRARALPLLGNASSFEEDEPYEEIGLPLARLFLDGGPADAQARAAVQSVARTLVGRVAFIARNATPKAHEWRQHGLPPGRFPAFGIAGSMTYNATRYAFLNGPRVQGVEFWAGQAKSLLAAFAEDVLAGRAEPSYMSEAPPSEDSGFEVPGPGVVRKLVGRECQAVVQASETEALVEGYDEWRRDHVRRTLQLDELAPLLAARNITVYRLDFGYNECPPGLLPVISAGYSGYFFVPRMSRSRGLRFQRLKKLDPPFDRVLKFVEKHSATKLNASIVLAEFERAVRTLERQKALQQLKSKWGVPITCAIGLGGALALFALRTRGRRVAKAIAAAGDPAASGVVPKPGDSSPSS